MLERRVKKRLPRIILMAVFALLVCGRPLRAKAAELTVSDVLEEPANAGYITANKWFVFPESTKEARNNLYYTVVTKPNTYYWAKLYEEYPSDYTGTMRYKTSLGRYESAPGGGSYISRAYPESYVTSSGSKKGATGWILFEPNQQIMVSAKRAPGHRIYLLLQEDEYGQKIDSIPNTAVFSRGDVIKGTLPNRDTDYFRFSADKSSLYRVRLMAEKLEPWPYDDNLHDYFNLNLVYYEDKKAVQSDCAPIIDPSYMKFGEGLSCSDGSTVFYLQLDPGKEYVFALGGMDCRYEVSFEKGTFEELEKLNLKLSLCVDVPDPNYPRTDCYLSGECVLPYEGKPVEPRVQIKTKYQISFGTWPDGSPRFRFELRDDNYTVTYRDNNAPGQAAAIVTGKGGLEGTLEIPFTLTAASGGQTPTPTKAPAAKPTVTPTKAPAAPTSAPVKPSGEKTEMYRLYNPNSGEHFYTANAAEKNYLASIGWNYEGIGWMAPASSKTPVYRLYNANAGDHHYTMSAGERDMLVSVGWSYEGIGWYSDDAKGVPLYRQYNPNAKAGSHNYTTSKAENDWLVSIGWNGEGIGWYGMK